MPPIYMLIKPASSLCNMRCKYCFYADVSDAREVKSHGMMSLDTLETIVRKALDYADGSCTFAFQGGEPTLAGIEFYKRLIELENQYNYKNVKIYNSIQTNGYDIGEEFAKFFSQNRFLVGLSIDGTIKTHDHFRVDASERGTFDKISKTIRIFEKYAVGYNILCVVTNPVASEPDLVYSSLKKHKFLQFIPCIENFGQQKKDYSLSIDSYAVFLKKTFDKYYKDFMSGSYVSIRNFDNYILILRGLPPESCSMNGICSCYFLIEADGSVYPCDFYALDDLKIGDIKKDSFYRMLKSDVANEFVESSKHTDENCLDCKWLNLCRGGCRRDREPFVDGKPALNKYCAAYKDFFEYAHERMVEIAQKA